MAARHRALVGFLLVVTAAGLAVADGRRFYDDDPLPREPESQNASGAQPEDVGLLYDLSYNLFVTSAKKPSNTRAGNANTVDEVPDSSWFTNRIVPRQPSDADFVRGPNTGPPPNPERWTITREKSGGFAPGFTATDANGQTWFVSFDPPGSPEGATGAMVIASKVFWALGYNQVETFITAVDPARLTIDPKATIKRPNGKRTPWTQDDLAAVFERAARNRDGTYRAAAGRLLSGKILGPFRYDGTRPDDPNDTVPHEHRRELRALRVFGAWTNLTDLKAGNTLDTLVEAGGRSIVKHYLQDVGSTFGIGANGPHDWDEGFEYFYEGQPTLRRMASLGFALSPWQTTPYTVYPSIGRFEADAFDPRAWKPHTPTSAYMEMREDDAFWAARRVAAFDDDLIRAIVHTGQFSNVAAEQHLAALLARRRDAIARAYLPAVNPIVNARLSDAGDRAFENAAVAAHVAAPPVEYRSDWFQFNNQTGESRPIGRAVGTGALLTAPRALPSAQGEIVRVDVHAEGQVPAAWRQPVRLFFRRGAGGWTLIGLERQ